MLVFEKKEAFMKFAIGILLIVHGLIVVAQSSGNFALTTPSGLQNPSWMGWWPTNLGRSWLLAWLGLERAPVLWMAGILWIAGGVALTAAGLGAMGIIIPADWWRSLAVSGAAISLVLLIAYLHPLMILGTVFSAVILVALLWARWPSQLLVP
jgi:hypothetical protein